MEGREWGGAAGRALAPPWLGCGGKEPWAASRGWVRSPLYPRAAQAPSPQHRPTPAPTKGSCGSCRAWYWTAGDGLDGFEGDWRWLRECGLCRLGFFQGECVQCNGDDLVHMFDWNEVQFFEGFARHFVQVFHVAPG